MCGLSWRKDVIEDEIKYRYNKGIINIYVLIHCSCFEHILLLTIYIKARFEQKFLRLLIEVLALLLHEVVISFESTCNTLLKKQSRHCLLTS